MFNNKKGLFNAFQILVSFALVAVVFIFSSYLLFNTGEEYLIDETANIGIDILSNQTSLPNSLGVDTINTLKTNYSNFLIPYDLFFLLMLIMAFVSTIVITFESNKEGIFSFFGFMFIGSLLLLLITTYISSFTDWFITELFDKVFFDEDRSLPIFYWYLNNLGIINFMWWLILILLSVIDRNFISRTGQVEQ